MRALAVYLILLLALPLATLAILFPANVYRAQGIAAPDCDGPLQVLIFALPAVLIYSAGAFLVYRAGRRFHRLVFLLCLVIALATVANIAEAAHELYRNAADGQCL
ncbi:UNVERIFIED_ORG: Mn2+/Fe2+ NRAMP family transporter [Rhizobium aethiopicum]